MREKKLTVLVLGLVCLGLLTYLVVYTVRVDEVAAHYRFGRVLRIVRPVLGIGGDEAIITGPGYPIETRAGVFFKLPWPFDRVEKRKQSVRYVDSPAPQKTLQDGNQIVPRVYATWRIIDPVAFQKSLRGDEETARQRLRNIISSQMDAVFGGYTLANVVNTDPSELKFDEIESKILKGVQDKLTHDEAYGIEVSTLGITWIALPDDVTPGVFERMQTERMTVAGQLRTEGDRIRRTTIAEAQQQRDQLLADTEAQSKDIRAQAEAEAAQYYETFARNESLAIFLRQLESLRRIAVNAQASGQPITIVVSTKSEPWSLLDEGPKVKGVQPPVMPDVTLSAQPTTSTSSPASAASTASTATTVTGPEGN